MVGLVIYLSPPLIAGRRRYWLGANRIKIGLSDLFVNRARVAGGQDYEVRYAAKKSGRSKSAVKKAVRKVGTSRRKVERRLKG
jgi:hypothetical protein